MTECEQFPASSTKCRRHTTNLHCNRCRQEAIKSRMCRSSSSFTAKECWTTTSTNTSCEHRNENKLSLHRVQCGLLALFTLYGGVYWWMTTTTNYPPVLVATESYCTATTDATSNCQRPDLVAYKVTSFVAMLVRDTLAYIRFHHDVTDRCKSLLRLLPWTCSIVQLESCDIQHLE